VARERKAGTLLAGVKKKTVPEQSQERIAALEKELAELKSRMVDAPAAPAPVEPPAPPANPVWQAVRLARHPKRPHSLDYIERMLTEFDEIHGDRAVGDDAAIVAGFGRLDGQAVAVIGQQKGRDTKQNVYRNFGMPKPEGYRKALRVMRMAAKFGRPIITMLDTPGAYPGIDAEERGQAEAIALNLREMSRLGVPIIVVVIGEGGSGGALALGVGNRVFMMENSIYSVISPESCAAIIYRDASKGEQAAVALKLDAGSLLKFGLIDATIPEPVGGAHTDYDQAAAALKQTLKATLAELGKLSAKELVDERYEKFRKMGNFFEEGAAK
jgi:acetyl-CoA carboxylase carboxyl transferase subunit alpha